MNKSKKLDKFLIKRGFAYINGRQSGEPDYVVGHYYKIFREREDLPFCLLNDKPPQIAIRHSFVDNADHFQIGFVNEAPQGWMDAKFYSMSADDLLNNLDMYLEALFAIWKTLFKEKGIKQ